MNLRDPKITYRIYWLNLGKRFFSFILNWMPDLKLQSLKESNSSHFIVGYIFCSSGWLLIKITITRSNCSSFKSFQIQIQLLWKWSRPKVVLIYAEEVYLMCKIQSKSLRVLYDFWESLNLFWTNTKYLWAN